MLNPILVIEKKVKDIFLISYIRLFAGIPYFIGSLVFLV
jgi:hypothetical protein